MGLAGGIIGGIIGGMIGGPWGIAIGAGLGSWLTGSGDKGESHRTEPGAEALEAWFLSLGKLAKADGIVTQNEADFISALLRSLEVPPEEKKRLIAAFNRGKSDPRPFAQCVQAAAVFSTDRQFRQSLMQTYCVLAIADGSLDEVTRDLLKAAEKALKVPGYADQFMAENLHSRSEAPHAAPSSGSDLAEAYQILGLAPDATVEELKQARRKKLLEYHPDRIQGKGLPESFLQFAAEQTRKINDAYERICARRGIR